MKVLDTMLSRGGGGGGGASSRDDQPLHQSGVRMWANMARNSSAQPDTGSKLMATSDFQAEVNGINSCHAKCVNGTA